jgi:alpha-ketoglutarate-dependent taurine dioxygenase
MFLDWANDRSVEEPAIDRMVLQTRGWVSFNLPVSTELDLHQQLLGMAAQLGTPIALRSGGGFCDALMPTKAQEAKPHSLSRVHSTGEFPLHIDTAHWLTPCRFIMLACVSPGSGGRPTMLLDTRRLALSRHQISLLHSTPLRVTNGRNSFFSTILSKTRRFVRFDPGCMTATTQDGAAALDVFSQYNWSDYIETMHWEAGSVLVINNWAVLHGRGYANCPDFDRKLLRISIQ